MTPRPTIFAAMALGLALAGLAATPSCQDFPPVLLCGAIPEGGCPIGRGGTCDDLVCRALYDCLAGSWTSVKNCPEVALPDAGAGGGQPLDAGPDSCTPVVISHAGEAFDCLPDPELPECPIGAADHGCI